MNNNERPRSAVIDPYLLCSVGITALSIVTLIGYIFLGWNDYPPATPGIYVNYGDLGLIRNLVFGLLILVSILTWFRRKIPQVAVAVLLASILLIYVRWCVVSYQLYNLSEDRSSFQSLLLLYKARPWDVLILVVSLVAFCAQCLFIAVSSRNDQRDIQ